MRDTRKNKDYFDSFLKYQYSRIDEKIEKAEKADKEKKQRILVSLTGYEVDLLKAEFSYGLDASEMKKSVAKAMNIICNYNNPSYDSLLVILSLASVLGLKKESVPFIKTNEDKINSDRLLSFLSSDLSSGKVNWNTNLELKKDYIGLNDVFASGEKEDNILKYLNDWYDNHSDYYWYNTHLSKSDTYCGYWSFESAAIAKILKLNENKLKLSVYYPQF